jgi:hypothetical protein
MVSPLLLVLRLGLVLREEGLGLNLGAPHFAQEVAGTQFDSPQPMLWHHHKFSQVLGRLCRLAWGLP